MALQITFGTPSGPKAIRVDDLGLEELEAIANDDEYAEGWGEITIAPFRNVKRTYAVLDAAADALGIEHVERNLTARSLDALLEVVPNIDEEPSIDGFPQGPGEPESGSTSGAPGDSDGPATNADSTS